MKKKLSHDSFIGVFKQKAKKTSLQTIIPEDVDNNVDTERDIHGSNLHGR